MKAISLICLVLILSAGCTSGPVKKTASKLTGILPWVQEEPQSDTPDPIAEATRSFTKYGVLMTVAGAAFAALTRFRTGLGLSLVLAGLSMIALAKTFSIPWIPWTALAIVGAYLLYRLVNWIPWTIQLSKSPSR